MGNITELKLDEIDYEIKRLNKELPHLELMFEIWNLKNQLPKVKGEIVPDGVDENDLQITETPAIGEWGLIIYRKIREREKELRGLGLRLLSYGEVTFNLERTREEINRLCNIRRKKLELEDTPASTPQDTAKQAKFTPFQTPHGTQWHEVKISFIDKDNVKISGRDKTEKRHYSEMGFKDNKSKRNESIFLWKFLKELASLSGKYTNCPDKEKDKVKKYFSDLRKVLFQLFKIDGDPIPYKKTKDYTGYETAFIIEDKSFSKEHEDSIRKHYKEYVPSKHKYICKDEDEGDEFTDNNYSLND